MSFFRQYSGLSTWIRVLIIFVVIWAVIVLLSVSKLNPPNSVNNDNTFIRLNRAISYLEETKKRNEELKTIIDGYLGENGLQADEKQKLIASIENNFQENEFRKTSNEPTLNYEKLRRRIHSNTNELWNFINAEILKIKKKADLDFPELINPINSIINLGSEHKRSLLNDIDHMRTLDGYEHWREKESNDLSDLVQKRLHYIQNPENCDKARKLVCRLNKGCGYGCQLHHVVYCFIMAYATERTLILKSKGWRYNKGGWEQVFKPISDSCLDHEGISHASWPGQHNTQILTLPIIDSLNPRPPYLPLAIPADLAPRLIRLHGDPIVWWVGQFLKYLLKPQPNTQKMLDTAAGKMGFKKPIVGVHVRRTDKVGTEAAFHGIDEYMTAVDDYYQQLEMTQNIEKRRVFLASDDAKVIEEARKKYNNYEIIGDQSIAKMAAVSTRYTDTSLNGIILDIHLLSLSDYLVCTFSSQVCRVAYEIMQTFYPDASNRFKSLDDIYYYGGQNAHNREDVIPHRPKNHEEIHMNVGDLVGVAGNHWNGFSKGKNTRTNQVGLFPSFKVNDKVEVVEFPTYAHVK